MYALGSCDTGVPGTPSAICAKLVEALQFRLQAIHYMADSPTSASREIRLHISGYRDMGGGTRTAIGVAAALGGGLPGMIAASQSTKDGIDVKVEVIDARTGSLISSSEFTYVSASERTEEELAEGVSATIVNFLRGRSTQE